jgi:hypothetical protein
MRSGDQPRNQPPIDTPWLSSSVIFVLANTSTLESLPGTEPLDLGLSLIQPLEEKKTSCETVLGRLTLPSAQAPTAGTNPAQNLQPHSATS